MIIRNVKSNYLKCNVHHSLVSYHHYFIMLGVRDFLRQIFFLRQMAGPCSCNYAEEQVFLLVVCEKPPTCFSEVKDNTTETDS